MNKQLKHLYTIEIPIAKMRERTTPLRVFEGPVFECELSGKELRVSIEEAVERAQYNCNWLEKKLEGARKYLSEVELTRDMVLKE